MTFNNGFVGKLDFVIVDGGRELLLIISSPANGIGQGVRKKK